MDFSFFCRSATGFLVAGRRHHSVCPSDDPWWLLVPLHLVTFFATALVCHGELAQDRPSTRHLTEFYLWLSIGGVVGGFFNALLAPIIFRSVQEYPLAMIAAALVRPYLDENRRSRRERWLDLLLPMALGLFVAGVILWSQIKPLDLGPQRLSSCVWNFGCFVSQFCSPTPPIRAWAGSGPHRIEHLPPPIWRSFVCRSQFLGGLSCNGGQK